MAALGAWVVLIITRLWSILIVVVPCYWFTGAVIIMWFCLKGIAVKIPVGMIIQTCKFCCCWYNHVLLIHTKSSA